MVDTQKTEKPLETTASTTEFFALWPHVFLPRLVSRGSKVLRGPRLHVFSCWVIVATFEISDGKTLVKFFGDDFSTCQDSTRNFGANFGATFGENFADFVSNSTIFLET